MDVEDVGSCSVDQGCAVHDGSCVVDLILSPSHVLYETSEQPLVHELQL